MSTNASDAADDRFPTLGHEDADFEDYGRMTTADGDVIIYHVDGDGAWIQADGDVELAEMR